MEKAILKGEVQQWQDDGVFFCGNRKAKSGIEKTTTGQRLHSRETDLKKEPWSTLSKALSSMSWDMSALENSGPSSSATNGASATQKQNVWNWQAWQVAWKNLWQILHVLCCAGFLVNFHVCFSYLGFAFQELPKEAALTPTNFTPSRRSKQTRLPDWMSSANSSSRFWGQEKNCKTFCAISCDMKVPQNFSVT